MTSIMDSKQKLIEILACLCEPEVDMWKLREYALSEGGLLHDAIRQNVWPKLLGLSNSDKDNQEGIVGPESIATNFTGTSCIDVRQIMNDAERTHNHICPSMNSTSSRGKNSTAQNDRFKKKLKKRQTRLAHLIRSALEMDDLNGIIDEDQYDAAIHAAYVRVGISSPPRSAHFPANHRRKAKEAMDVGLQYYQGFHDVASIVQSTMYTSRDEQSFSRAVAVLHRIGKCHLRDALRKDFSEVIATLKITLFPLIAALGEYEVHDYLVKSKQEPYFALSWVITWFSHDIVDSEIAKRIFDACLASHPLLPVYLSIAMILHPYNRRLILDKHHTDFASVHSRLCQLPKNSSPQPPKNSGDTSYLIESVMIQVPFQDLINNAISFMRRIPPRNILRVAAHYQNGILFQVVKSACPSMLFPPKQWRYWSLSSSMPSDWVVKQRGKNGAQSNDFKESASNEEVSVTKKRKISKDNIAALIATGICKGELWEKNKARQHLVVGSLAAAVLSVGFYMMNNDAGGFNSESPLRSDLASLN